MSCEAHAHGLHTWDVFSDFSHLIQQKRFTSLVIWHISICWVISVSLFSPLLLVHQGLKSQITAFFFPVLFQHAWKNFVSSVLCVCLKEGDERWYLCQSFRKYVQSTVCFVPCWGVDSQLVTAVAGVAEVVTVLAVIHSAPPELPTSAAALVSWCCTCSSADVNWC